MPLFAKGGSTGTPFGPREFLRSTNPKPITESYIVAATSVPARTIDGNAGQKILQPGTAMAKITTAAGTSTADDVGKIGPFQAGVTDGRQLVANLVGLDLTFLPWQLINGDREVSVVVNGTAVQSWCVELDAGGVEIALANTTADAMRGGKRLDINFS